MERCRLAPEVAFVLRAGVPLEVATIAPVTAPFEPGSSLQAAIFRFVPGGQLPRYPATIPQTSPSSTAREP